MINTTRQTLRWFVGTALLQDLDEARNVDGHHHQFGRVDRHNFLYVFLLWVITLINSWLFTIVPKQTNVRLPPLVLPQRTILQPFRN